MKAPSVFLLFGLYLLLPSELTLSAISLNVSPNRQQFFTGESVQMICEEEESPAGWKLKRIPPDSTETCGAAEGFGKLNGSSCTISNLSPSSDPGVYWCEQASGMRSINVTITVSDRPFIMDIPALPVMAGSNVTLRCRNRTGSAIPVHFFKFSRHSTPITFAPKGEFTISNVQQSDEVFYWCSTDLLTVSPSSRLNVQAHPLTISTSIRSASPLLRLICHLVVCSPYCISTGLMLSIYCCRGTGKTAAVTMEMAQHAERDQGSDNESVSDTADVTTKHDF